MHGPTGIFWANLTPFALQLMSYGAITMMKDAVGGESAEDNWNAAWAVYGYLGAPNAGCAPRSRGCPRARPPPKRELAVGDP